MSEIMPFEHANFHGAHKHLYGSEANLAVAYDNFFVTIQRQAVPGVVGGALAPPTMARTEISLNSYIFLMTKYLFLSLPLEVGNSSGTSIILAPHLMFSVSADTPG
jgi:hypothetical protein